MMVPRRGKALANWTRPSIDEMGVPTESWKQVIFRIFLKIHILCFLVQVHDKNQSKYMIHLLAGVGAMGVSLVAFSQMVFMNATPKHLMK